MISRDDLLSLQRSHALGLLSATAQQDRVDPATAFGFDAFREAQ